jgi:predicted transcriptional regulator
VDEQFEEIGYLLRSGHRVQALASLCEGPLTVTELADATGASRKTIKRAVRTFDEYGWVRATGDEYELTPTGRLVTDRTQRLVAATEATRRLRPVAQWLPGSFDVDPEHLADAEITLPDDADTTAPARRMVEVLRGADEVRAVAFAVAPGAVEATRQSESATLVLTPEAVSFVREDPEMAGPFAEILDAGWPVYEYDGDLEFNLVVADETVMLGLVDAGGAPSGLVESRNEHVHRWALDRFERCREQAEPVDAGLRGEPVG